MKILFHGASVTEQSGEGSYFFWLNEALKYEPRIELYKRGYGGTHFDSACVLTIRDDIGSVNPDICFLDWNTTGSVNFDPVSVSYVIGSLLSFNVIPVFLILARVDNIQGNRQCDSQVISFCEEKKVPFLDLRNLVDPSLHLRDEVHTNLSGAALYANAIAEFIEHLFVNNMHPQVERFEFLDLNINSKRKLNISISENDFVRFSVSRISESSRVVIETIHGPESPVIKVMPSGLSISVWDRWSHFHRPGFVQLWSFRDYSLDSDANLCISVLSDVIDYSSCRRDFSFEGEKFLTISGIYGVNCFVDLIYE
nr:hypothetical protein [uncultured Limnohabitans sp.]